MPATEHRFNKTPLPRAIFLDADFVVSVLHESEQFHRDCSAFAYRLLRSRVVVLHTQLLRLEFLSGWQSAIRRRGIPRDLLPQQRLWRQPEDERAALYEIGDGFLLDFLNAFERYEVRLSARLQERARRAMADYNLKPMDACLVASSFQVGVPDIASLDARFRRVEGIRLWNDRIPQRRQAARHRA